MIISKLKEQSNKLKNEILKNVFFYIWYFLIWLSLLFLFSKNINFNQFYILKIFSLIFLFTILPVIFSNYVNDVKQKWVILISIWIIINHLSIYQNLYGLPNNSIIFVILSINVFFSFIIAFFYKSRFIFLLSFALSFINPFLSWVYSWFFSKEFLLYFYSIILSIISFYFSYKRKDVILFFITLVLWNFLFILPDYNSTASWIIWMLSSLFLYISSFSVLHYYNDMKVEKKYNIILFIFILFYTFISYHLFSVNLEINSLNTIIFFAITILIVFIFNNYLIKKYNNIINTIVLKYLLYIPIILFSILFLFSSIIYFPIIFIVLFIIYLISLRYLKWDISNTFYQSFFVIFWIILSLFLSFLDYKIFNNTPYILFIGLFILYLWSSYYYSTLKDLWKLFWIWTFFSFFIFSPILINELYVPHEASINLETIDNTSIILILSSILIFLVLNIFSIFLSYDFLRNKNLRFFQNWFSIFVIFWVFIFYKITYEIFSLEEKGIIILIISILYFISAYITKKIKYKNTLNKIEDTSYYYIFAIWIISLIISIFHIFHNNILIEEILLILISLFLYNSYRNTNKNIYFLLATWTFVISLFKLNQIINIYTLNVYTLLVFILNIFVIIYISFLLNKTSNNNIESNNTISKLESWESNQKTEPLSIWEYFKNNSQNNIYYILHLTWISLIIYFIYKLLWFNIYLILLLSIFSTFLWFFYAKINSYLLKGIFTLLMIVTSFLHIFNFDIIQHTLININTYWTFIQYIISLIIISNFFIWKKINKNNLFNNIMIWIVILYSFFISNLYIISIFELILKQFTLTAYWWIVGISFIVYWLYYKKLKYRTIWLYFLTIMISKVFLYDIWISWNVNSKIFVFTFLWIIFIVLWSFYNKKDWNNILEEFNLKHLKNNIKTNYEQNN